MQNIEQEILAKNYQLSDFAEELLEGYQCLVNADVLFLITCLIRTLS